MLFRELYPIPALDVPSLRYIQYPVSLSFPSSHVILKCAQHASSQFPNISLHALAQYHYAHTCIVMCGLHDPIEFWCVASVYRIGRLSRPLQHTASLAFSRRRVLVVLAPLSVYFLLVSYVPLPGDLLSVENRTLTLVIARYNVLGTIILGSLSGFGSVTTAWGYFPLSCGKNRHVNYLPGWPYPL
jgi:hypothetical protein